MLRRENSQRLFDEAKVLFPGGVNSPVRAFKSVYGPPLFIKKGKDCYLFDEDDNQFIDFCGSWGPLILGHDHPDIRKAVLDTAVNGLTFGAPSVHGNLLGKKIISNHQFIDKLRFVSSGTEAVMSAIRLARGFTGKSKILKFEGCYHGHADSLLVKAGSGLATFGVSTSAGVPPSFADQTLVIELGDLQKFKETLEYFSDDLACVIIEPIPANNGLLLQDISFLAAIRTLCDDYGVLLIFDEVISGFRVGFEGASGYYSIQPDLLTFGKIIGGGLPVGAFGGRRDIMKMISPEGPVYQAGTLSANPVAMAAGSACLDNLLDIRFYENLSSKSKNFTDAIRNHIGMKGYPMQVISIASIFWFSFSDKRIVKASEIDPQGLELFKELHRYLLDHGVYLGPSGYEVGFVSSAHPPEVLSEAAQIICNGIDRLYK